MSTLSVSNITDGTTTVGTSYVVNGSAKAWVNFNGQGTIAARDSMNVASLTDNGTGDHSISFSNSFANANYAASMSSSSGALSNSDTMVNPYTWATGSTSIGTNNNSGAPVDRSYVNLSIHGDLA
jgi:hypothetical protein